MNNNIIYPYLPIGRSINYVPISNVFMKEAFEYARIHSSDRLQPTGAVVVMNDTVIGRGANQSPIKNSWLQEKHSNGLCVRKIFKIASGKKYWLCPGCSTWKHHAEQRAVRDAKLNNEYVEGADLYLWGHWWCCEPCWKCMINSGIRNVYLLDNSYILFNSKSSKNILGRQFK